MEWHKVTERGVEISKGEGAVKLAQLLSPIKTPQKKDIIIDPELGLPSYLCGCGVEKCIH
jgi:hypothetical protein